jgi:hypothetical protein
MYCCHSEGWQVVVDGCTSDIHILLSAVESEVREPQCSGFYLLLSVINASVLTFHDCSHSSGWDSVTGESASSTHLLFCRSLSAHSRRSFEGGHSLSSIMEWTGFQLFNLFLLPKSVCIWVKLTFRLLTNLLLVFWEFWEPNSCFTLEMGSDDCDVSGSSSWSWLWWFCLFRLILTLKIQH